MKQRLIFLSGALLLLLFGLACRSPKSAASQRPNVVIILADDQGWGDLSINGNPVVSTPNIDQLAKDGVSLENFYVEAVCSPTRAALLSGRYAVRGGVYATSEGGERLDLDEPTFAKLFQQNGYQTAAFGKWHNGMQGPYHPNSRGFDEFVGYCSGHWGSYFDAILEHNGELIQSEGFLTDFLTDKAIEFIQKERENPFLLYLPLNTPHSPMQVPDRWWNKFENTNLPQHRYSDRENVAHTKAAYAMSENIDWNVGRVVAQLEEMGLSENTLIVYFSDNGPNGWRWNGGMEGIKGHVDEGGVKSPCFIKYPKRLKAGKKIMSITSVMDLFPTFMDLAEIEYDLPKKLDGVGLSNLLLTEQDTAQNRIIVNHWKDKISVRSNSHRLNDKDELFNLSDDPGQRINLKDSIPETYEWLLRHKNNWKTHVLAELPPEDQRPLQIGGDKPLVTQLPARDAHTCGNIKRSNRWPNCSFLTNWISKEDSISWDIELLESADYEVELYYTCKASDIGAEISLSFGQHQLNQVITEPFDPPLRGAEYDRVMRGESYVKDFKALAMGNMIFEKGKGKLVLKATSIPGDAVIDFRMLLLRKVLTGTNHE